MAGVVPTDRGHTSRRDCFRASCEKGESGTFAGGGANENHEEEDQVVVLDPETEEDLKRERGRHEKTLLLQAQDVRQQKDAAGG